MPNETDPLLFSAHKRTIITGFGDECHGHIVDKASTQRDYRDILNNHVLPAFEDTPIKEINRGTIKKFLLKKSNDGYAISTVSHMHDVISGVLNDAVDDEIILANPSLRLGKFLASGKKKKQIDALSAGDLTRLLNTVATHYPNHYTLFLVLARTGMRIGEAKSKSLFESK